jgi:hypothetical protein
MLAACFTAMLVPTLLCDPPVSLAEHKLVIEVGEQVYVPGLFPTLYFTPRGQQKPVVLMLRRKRPVRTRGRSFGKVSRTIREREDPRGTRARPRTGTRPPAPTPATGSNQAPAARAARSVRRRARSGARGSGAAGRRAFVSGSSRCPAGATPAPSLDGEPETGE